MKKLIVLMLLCFSFVLTACEKEGVIEDVPCTEQQIEVDGECIDLTGQEIQLRTVLKNTAELTNYQFDVEVIEGENNLNIIMLFDDNKAAIQTANQIDYYLDDSGVCQHTTVMNNVIFENSYDCFTNNSFLFYKGFDYTYFRVVDGKYNLNSENYQTVEAFFQNAFPNSTLESFKMATTGTLVSEMFAELLIDGQTYFVTMTISEVDNVTIEIPTKGVN